MKKTVTIIAIWLVLMQTTLYAQYTDHRNRQVDSLEIVLATNPPTGADLALVYRELMWGYQQINVEKSMDYARKCLGTVIPLKGLKVAADCYRLLGMGFVRLSQYDSATVYYDKALDAAERMVTRYTETEIEEMLSATYGSMGNLYNIQGNYHEAVEYYQKALTIFEKYDWKESQTIAYNNIGEMYQSMNNYAQAENNFIKLDSLAHITGVSLHIAYAKKQFGHLYLRTQDYEKALQNVETAYEYFFSHPEEEGENRANILNLLSEIYLEGYADDRQAEEYARAALLLLEDLGIPREKAISLRLLSTIHLKRGDWRRSEQTALEALAADDSEPANTLALYAILVKAYAHLGNAALSADYFDRYDALKSIWSNKNYQSSLSEMEVKYETEKKENEIERQKNVIDRQNMQRSVLAGGVAFCMVFVALLWYMLQLRTRRNRALSERSATLSEMNAAKDKFFSIISHDLKNPAVAQRDALQMLVQNAHLWNTATLTDYCNELLKSAEGQVELILHLLGWARLQTGRMTYTPQPFYLATRLVADISLIGAAAAKKGVTLITQIADDVQVSGDSNMLCTVIRNLLANAVKFTASGGVVTLEAAPANDGKYIVSVSDTGVGMTREQVETWHAASLQRINSAPSQKGTAGEQGSGLGLIVCREMLGKHGTTLHVESEEGKGSRFWFELRIES